MLSTLLLSLIGTDVTLVDQNKIDNYKVKNLHSQSFRECKQQHIIVNVLSEPLLCINSNFVDEYLSQFGFIRVETQSPDFEHLISTYINPNKTVTDIKKILVFSNKAGAIMSIQTVITKDRKVAEVIAKEITKMISPPVDIPPNERSLGWGWVTPDGYDIKIWKNSEQEHILSYTHKDAYKTLNLLY